jgi:predicted nucleotidyltransferase
MKTVVKLNKEGIIDYLKAHKTDLKSYKVKPIGLFGSFARGEAKEDSDIDLIVEYEPGHKTFDNFMGLINFLESSFDREVELVTKESISKYIWPYIKKDVEYVEIVN